MRLTLRPSAHTSLQSWMLWQDAESVSAEHIWLHVQAEQRAKNEAAEAAQRSEADLAAKRARVPAELDAGRLPQISL